MFVLQLVFVFIFVNYMAFHPDIHTNILTGYECFVVDMSDVYIFNYDALVLVNLLKVNIMVK